MFDWDWRSKPRRGFYDFMRFCGCCSCKSQHYNTLCSITAKAKTYILGQRGAINDFV